MPPWCNQGVMAQSRNCYTLLPKEPVEIIYLDRFVLLLPTGGFSFLIIYNLHKSHHGTITASWRHDMAWRHARLV